MIEYNRYSWWGTVFSIRGTALPRAIGRVVIFTLYAVLVEITVTVYTGWLGDPLVFNLDPVAHAVLGSLLGFLIVFRMNASNSRYWEGRSHWGALINASRNLVRVGVSHTNNGAELAGLVAGYSIALKQSLRGSRELEEAAIYLPESVLRNAERYGNQPTAIAAAISAWIARQRAMGVIDGHVTQYMEQLLSAMVDAQGGCEKIQKTPLPFVYVSMIKLLIVTYLLTLPLVLATRCGWLSPLLMAVISLGLLGMEEASVETEDPFGRDDNCLALETYTLTITRDACQIAEWR
jgi:putative membrane protein